MIIPIMHKCGHDPMITVSKRGAPGMIKSAKNKLCHACIDRQKKPSVYRRKAIRELFEQVLAGYTETDRDTLAYREDSVQFVKELLNDLRGYTEEDLAVAEKKFIQAFHDYEARKTK